jgi:hypothetical protein
MEYSPKSKERKMFAPTVRVTFAMLAAMVLASGGFAQEQQALVVQFDATGKGIVGLHLLREGGKVVAGFALETDRTPPWIVDVTHLEASADGRIKGPVKCAQAVGIMAQRAAAERGSAAPAPTPDSTTS